MEKINSIVLEKRRKHWYEAYDKCNEAQKKAIDTIQDPVLVIAGPGTGKTQILALRIGKILLETDTSPQSILCLTYTDAGTIAMRKRLEQYIQDDAYKVQIFTFHAFCNQVIKSNPYYFRNKEGFEPLSELEEIEIFREIIQELPADSPLKRLGGDIYYDTTRLKNLFSGIKKDNINVQQKIEEISFFKENLHLCEDLFYKRNYGIYKAGDLKQKDYNEKIEQANVLQEAYRLFYIYEKKLHEAKRYDYHDMIRWVIEAFENHEDLLRNYQERFLYFLVDEYQDTNGAQAYILDLLTNYEASPNVFAVGDDDQCVYTFQGAHRSRVEDFVQRYNSEGKLTVVVLTENYRSTQAILDVAYHLIENNATRLTKSPVLKAEGIHISKTLYSASPNYTQANELYSQAGFLNAGVRICEYLNHLHEEADLVYQIKQLIEIQHVPPHEIAVLFRKNKQAVHIQKALNYYGIPYYARQTSNALDEPIVNQIISFIKYLKEEMRQKGDGEYLLFKMLHYPYFNIEAKNAIRFMQENASVKYKRDLLRQYEVLFSKGYACLDGMKKVDALLDKLFAWMHTYTPQLWLEKLYDHSGMLLWALRQPDKFNQLEYLNAVMNFFKEETAKNPQLTLFSILEKLEAMKHHGLQLKVEKITVTKEAVQLLTAHSAKGLEFDYVFMIDNDASNWEESRPATSNFASLPALLEGENGHFKFGDQRSEKVDPEEERRLFYVAMTRAKKQLQISYSKMKANDQNAVNATGKSSIFIANILAGVVNNNTFTEDKILKITEKAIANENLEQYMMHALAPAVPPLAPIIEHAYLDNFLEHYKLSVTNLNKYLKCPLTFYYETVLKIPRARTASTGFGKAIHYCLECTFTEWAKKKVFPTVEQMIIFFKNGMYQTASHFTEDEFENYILKGENVIKELYEAKYQQWITVPDVRLEYRCDALLEGIPLTGVLDKLEFQGNNVTVVDYKTGSYAKNKSKNNPPYPPKEGKPETHESKYGGDYWRQMVFYKLLLDHNLHHSGWNVVECRLEFVEKEKDDHPIMRWHDQQNHLEIVKNQIKTAYAGIRNKEFHGCNEPDCEWCQYTLHHHAQTLPALDADET